MRRDQTKAPDVMKLNVCFSILIKLVVASQPYRSPDSFPDSTHTYCRRMQRLYLKGVVWAVYANWEDVVEETRKKIERN